MLKNLVVNLKEIWSLWSEWSECKEKCNFQGESLGIGYQKRRRHCLKQINQLKPFCQGEIIQKKICHNCNLSMFAFSVCLNVFRK